MTNGAQQSTKAANASAGPASSTTSPGPTRAAHCAYPPPSTSPPTAPAGPGTGPNGTPQPSPDVADHIADLVAAAPPLTMGQRARLAVIFRHTTTGGNP